MNSPKRLRISENREIDPEPGKMRDLFNRICGRLLVPQPPPSVAPQITDLTTLTVLLLEYFISRNFRISRTTDVSSFSADADDWKRFLPENVNTDIRFYIRCKEQTFNVRARIIKSSNAVDIALIHQTVVLSGKYAIMLHSDLERLTDHLRQQNYEEGAMLLMCIVYTRLDKKFMNAFLLAFDNRAPEDVE